MKWTRFESVSALKYNPKTACPMHSFFPAVTFIANSKWKCSFHLHKPLTLVHHHLDEDQATAEKINLI